MRWFTSDTHFGHQRIIELCNRPFSSVEEMNESLIRNWNSVVHPRDIVYHLGDVALGTIADSLPLVGRLNGYKILVPGNHDRVFSGEKDRMRERFEPKYREVFREIWSEEASMRLADGTLVVLSHFPYEGDSQENDRHVDKRPLDDGFSPLIHGHIHDKRRVEGRMFNVGVDVNGFVPVSEDQIIEWVGSL